ncbi:hypothetical protein QA648_28345 (plasmid) [Rhizobium sp. CB3171]|uniref:hypothetical protein n=1 Tax=Rhizobium sp. CB3171 TaxID=3039157 RepID=UPI0024B0D6E9|nr:hypothetical protein [Rhizobium sp. CB3171]WFU04679.1 hypothetical protein QA648_28345 [Rhizobium sp. CB3171]
MAEPGTEFSWNGTDYVVDQNGRVSREVLVENRFLPYLGDFGDDEERIGALISPNLLLDDMDWSVIDIHYEILEYGDETSKVLVSGDPSYVVWKLEMETPTFWAGTPWAR